MNVLNLVKANEKNSCDPRSIFFWLDPTKDSKLVLFFIVCGLFASYMNTYFYI